MKNFIYAILMLLFTGCSGEMPETTTQASINEQTIRLTEAQLKTSGITTGKISSRIVSERLTVHGKVEAPPQNVISVSSYLGGFIKSTDLLPGMKVKKGEVLAILEDQLFINLQQDYLNGKIKLELSEREYRRQKSLNETKATSDKVFQDVESDYNTSKINLASLRQKLQLLSVDPDRLNENNISRALPIYSPITGYVTRVHVNVGKYVSPSDVLFELVNPDDIHLALTVFEKDIQKLKVGQKVLAYTNNSEKKYDCEIILLGKSLTPERSLDIHCHFNQYDHDLLPGMYMNADIICESDSAFVLPTAAIVAFESKDYVFVELAHGVFKLQPIKTGVSNNGYTKILDDQSIDQAKIVTQGAYTLLMALKNKEE